MKHLFVLLTFVFSFQAFAKKAPVTVVMENPVKIADLLTAYPLFSNKIVAQGAAFGFTPMVTAVNAKFTEIQSSPEFTDCKITLTAELKAGPNKSAVPAGVVMPVQSYEEEGPCESVMASKLYDI